MKCLACHEFRLSKRQCRVFCAKLHLLDVGRIKESLELEDGLASVAREAGAGRLDVPQHSSSKAASRRETILASARVIDDFLDSKLGLGPLPSATSLSPPRPTDNDDHGGTVLTLHERAARRQVLKEFQSACTKALKCANCSAFSP